jgi:hypothetical protein
VLRSTSMHYPHVPLYFLEWSIRYITIDREMLLRTRSKQERHMILKINDRKCPMCKGQMVLSGLYPTLRIQNLTYSISSAPRADR